MTHQKYVLYLHEDDNVDSTLEQAFLTRGFQVHSCHLNDFNTQNLAIVAPVGILANITPDNLRFVDDIQAVFDHYQRPDIPVLGLLSSTLPVEVNIFDSVLLAPAYPEQIILRLQGLIRLRSMEQEINLRLTTLREDFGIQPDLPKAKDPTRFNILFIGKATPEFMVIINALQKRNVNVVAAFTSFTAFEYLYEQTFDAVVMNGLGTIEPAKTIIETMRKNAKLYHVPTLMIVDPKSFSEHDAMFLKGLNDFLDAGSNPEEISSRIIEQANFYRLHDRLKLDFGALGNDECLDAGTSLYNRAFFNAHLARLNQFCSQNQQPLSLSLIRIKPKKGKSPAHLGDAYEQIGAMLKNLLRMQDTVARLEPNVFAVAFPGQDTEELKPVADRLASVLRCASLTSYQDGHPIHFDIEITLNSLNQAERKSHVA